MSFYDIQEEINERCGEKNYSDLMNNGREESFETQNGSSNNDDNESRLGGVCHWERTTYKPLSKLISRFKCIERMDKSSKYCEMFRVSWTRGIDRELKQTRIRGMR
jgi:hypothetical protein